MLMNRIKISKKTTSNIDIKIRDMVPMNPVMMVITIMMNFLMNLCMEEDGN